MRRLFVPDRYEATEWYEGALGMKVYSEDGARTVSLDLPPDGRLRVAGARAATPNLVTEVGGGPSSTNSSTVSGGAILLSVAAAMLRGRLVPNFGDPDAYKALRRAEVLAVSAALAAKG